MVFGMGSLTESRARSAAPRGSGNGPLNLVGVDRQPGHHLIADGMLHPREEELGQALHGQRGADVKANCQRARSTFIN
jgi:hypothetical protein